MNKAFLVSLAVLLHGARAAPFVTTNGGPTTSDIANPKFGPKPGESSLYSTYYGRAPPFPANEKQPIPATQKGHSGPDDVLWQNLLAAEWIVCSFYQSAVETFNASSFTELGLANTTYQRIMEIRDNEAGHLPIFQNQISATSIKPGACKYMFPYDTAQEFLALQTFIEISSMAFLTGLVQHAKQDSTKGALVAVSQAETRHEVWSLMSNWNAEPFSGPSDLSYPYANQILESTKRFVIYGSCPSENPEYPSPVRHLPPVSAASGTKSILPGATIGLNFTDPSHQPDFEPHKEYYAVFYHGVETISIPINVSHYPGKPLSITIPKELEARGLIIANIATVKDAVKEESVVAGPLYFLQQPKGLGLQVLG